MFKTRSVSTLPIALLGLFLACLMPAAKAGAQADRREPARFEFTKVLMGTQARVVLYAESAESARQAAGAAFEEIARLDAVMSDYRPDSELMRLCERAGEGPVPVSETLFDVLQRSQAIAGATDGAFDITVGPLVRLWREARRSGELPDPEALLRARRLVGPARLKLDADARTAELTSAGMRLDLGGIGKGYAADRALAVLKDLEVRSALIDFGGDLVAGDPPPGKEAWTVRVGEGTGAPALALANSAIATSGDQEQFVEIGGVRYSHIVDPRTGEALRDQTPVTVRAPDGATADALASARSVGYSALEATNRPPPGFVALFNGEDLAGWRGLEADPPQIAQMSEAERAEARRAADESMLRHWSVQNGVLKFDGAGQSLVTAREFGDFELLLDWKIGPGGDSGLYLRGTPQVQIWDHDTGSGGLYNNQKGPSVPLEYADHPPGVWNTFRIVMRGERVTVHLNDRLVVDDVPLENYWDRSRPLPARGQIELQAHGSPLWFRNVYLRELDPE